MIFLLLTRYKIPGAHIIKTGFNLAQRGSSIPQILERFLITRFTRLSLPHETLFGPSDERIYLRNGPNYGLEARGQFSLASLLRITVTESIYKVVRRNQHRTGVQ